MLAEAVPVGAVITTAFGLSSKQSPRKDLIASVTKLLPTPPPPV
jgi:hypothetical protein